MNYKPEKASFFAMLSRTYRKTGKWEAEGLITADQRDAILSFERTSSGKRMIRALFGLGIFAIALGMLSLIAANWVNIPGEVKIAAHFMLNLLAALVIYRSEKNSSFWWREGATAIFFALNLTLIVLIGQVFHLDGNTAAALGLWMAISTPAVFIFGRSALNALLWTIAAVATTSFVLAELVRHADDFTQFLTLMGTGLFVPLALLAAGASEKLEKLRPQWSALVYRAGLLMLIVGATTASLWWYDDIGRELSRMFTKTGNYGLAYGAMALICLSAPAAVLGFDWFRKMRGGQDNDRTGIFFALASLASITGPMLVMAPEAEFFGALHFIVYWLFLAWIAVRIRSDLLLSWAIWLVTLRVVIIYFELFGSLLNTGLSLITGGVVLLLALRAGSKIRKRLTFEGKE